MDELLPGKMTLPFLREWRVKNPKGKRFSVRTLAKEANVSPTTISRAENRLIEVQVGTAQALADALGVPLHTLWKDQPPQERYVA